MPIKHAVWKVGSVPQLLTEVSLESEALLEQMIVADPGILSPYWLLIGQQVRTDYGGIVDLLAVNQDGQLIVIELKRNQTPREVVAQALDYASWARDLTSDEIAHIFDRFSGGGALDAAFQRKFNQALDEEQLNGSHQIVVVASSLDPSTERIVNYLNEMDVAINVIFFQVLQDEDRQYLSRAWLIDPFETEIRATSVQSGERGEWNGEFYVSFGHSAERDWGEAVKYGFICAGGGAWYSRTLSQLSPGDRVWVNVPGQGYVGVGKITGQSGGLRGWLLRQSELNLQTTHDEMEPYGRTLEDCVERGEAEPCPGFFAEPLNLRSVARGRLGKWAGERALDSDRPGV